MGIYQSNLGIWQILARQGEIPEATLNDSWLHSIEPFATVKTSVQLFDAGRASLGEIIRAAAGKSDLSQDEVIALLAGPSQLSPEGQQVKQEIAQRIRTVMDDQRLLSLDTLFALGDGLNRMAQGQSAPDNLLARAQELREFEMPRPFFTNTERSEWAAGPLQHQPRHAANAHRSGQGDQGAEFTRGTGRRARRTRAAHARHSGGPQLRLLRAALRAGAAQ